MICGDVKMKEYKMNNISSEELNLRSLRKLLFMPGGREHEYPHKFKPNTLWGTITTDINQNGWRLSKEVFEKFVTEKENIYLTSGLATEIKISEVAGKIRNAIVDPRADKTYLYIVVELLETPMGKYFSTLGQNKEWLESHCFTLGGIGESIDGIVKDMTSLRLNIGENKDI